MLLPLGRLDATVRVLRWDFFSKVVTRHDTGMGEAYMDGDFEAEDMGALMAVVTANATNIQGSRGALGLLNWLGDRALYLAHRARANTIEGSRRNIEEHYDAGNDMYKLFLDDTMMYSSGEWGGANKKGRIVNGRLMIPPLGLECHLDSRGRDARTGS